MEQNYYKKDLKIDIFVLTLIFKLSMVFMFVIHGRDREQKKIIRHEADLSYKFPLL